MYFLFQSEEKAVLSQLPVNVFALKPSHARSHFPGIFQGKEEEESSLQEKDENVCHIL